jgi:hypothetical protein
MNQRTDAHARKCWRPLCLVLLLGACSKGAQPGPVSGESAESVTTNQIALTAADTGKTVSLKPEQELSITLQTVGPGRYGDPQISSAAVRSVGEGQPGVQNPGGPRQVLRFQAVSVGEAEITVPHSQSSEAFRLKVIVE